MTKYAFYFDDGFCYILKGTSPNDAINDATNDEYLSLKGFLGNYIYCHEAESFDYHWDARLGKWESKERVPIGIGTGVHTTRGWGTIKKIVTAVPGPNTHNRNYLHILIAMEIDGKMATEWLGAYGQKDSGGKYSMYISL